MANSPVDDSEARSESDRLQEQIDENIENVARLKRRDWETASPFQRRIERVSSFIGRPFYLLTLLSIIVLWLGINIGFHWRQLPSWDPPPFELLDGVMTFLSLVTTTIVLIAQNRQTRMEQQHTHLDLQVNLLTEQKVTKLIHLIEELRNDLPMVKDRHDPQSKTLQERTDPVKVLSAIEERGLTADKGT